MKVLTLFPPNYQRINKAFGVRGKPVIFAYGAIYNPSKIKIPPQLLVHEAVHIERQGDDPERWWERYIEDPRFRLEEEIPAHVAEYRVMKPLDGPGGDRWLNLIAERLASPLYGSLIGQAAARSILAHWTREHATAPTGQ